MTSIPWDELMDAAGDSDFAPIPQGDYDVKIISSEATKSSTDKPMWKLTCEVESGPHQNRRIWTQQTLTVENPNALNVFFRQMAAAGLTGDFFKTKPSNQQIADALLGRRFRARVAIRAYMGQDRNEIKNWAPAAGAAGAPPTTAPSSASTPPPPPTAAPGPPPTTNAGSPPPPPPPPPAPPAPPSGSESTPSPAPNTPDTPDNEPTTPDNEPSAPSSPAPPDNTPDPPSNTPSSQELQPVTASAGAPGTSGVDPSAWVVEERKQGSMDEPPF
jgi:hypothetical protein